MTLNQGSCWTFRFLLCMHITAPSSRVVSQGVMNFQYWEWLRDIKAGIHKVINLILFSFSLASSLSKTLTSSISPVKERNQSPRAENENPNLHYALEGFSLSVPKFTKFCKMSIPSYVSPSLYLALSPGKQKALKL